MSVIPPAEKKLDLKKIHSKYRNHHNYRSCTDKRTTQVVCQSHGARLYGKPCLKQPLSKRPNIGFQDQLSLNAGKKYCRMLQGEHSAILSTFIKLPFAIKIVVLSILNGRLKQVLLYCSSKHQFL